MAEVEAENFYFSNFRNALDLKSALSRTIVLSQKGRCKDMGLTIREVSKKYAIPADTLRYYEKIGVIPPVTRTAGGIRDYSEDDISWVENAKCMRAAGLSIEFLIEYQKLYSGGDSTFQARLDLLNEQRKLLQTQKKQIEETLAKLDFKISKYEEAIETGILVWNCHSDTGRNNYE